jgi:flagellar biosynthesis protein FlhA
MLNRIGKSMEDALVTAISQAVEPLLITAPDIRPLVANLASRHAPGLAVLSFREVDPKANVKSMGTVSLAGA